MIKFLRVAAIAIPTALTAMAPVEARANPMVAVGWLWAAGAGGLVLGFLGGSLYAQNRLAVVTPAYAEPVAPVVYQQPQDGYGCRNVRIKIDGRTRRAQICD
jgi:hypothetical protein